MMLAFLPDALGMALTELTQVLHWANAVSLNDAYKATFGVSIAPRHVDETTGEVRSQRRGYGRYKPDALSKTNRAFRRLLTSQGMSRETARKYVLVGDYIHASTRGQVLLAVVLRHTRTAAFRARHKQTAIVTTFNADQRAWYEAYERDVNGQVIDEVIDWAPLEYGVLGRDQAVATLLVLATEAVKFDKRSPDYWHAERQWLAGDTAAVMQQSAARVQQALHELPGSIARRAAGRPRAAPTASPGEERRTERRSYRSHRGLAPRGRTTPRAS
jgi:hypothetical protein